MKKFFTTSLTIVSLLLVMGSPAFAIERGTQLPPDTVQLKPDQYIWNPGASPTGSVGIIVDLTNQMIYIYRDGKLIGRSAVSTGVKRHPTAPGAYTILTKNLKYHSEKYHEASMPYMERLTWDGMAIHGGNNPGEPSSHGCVHVPLDFAKKLFGITKLGDTVLVSDLKQAPGDTVNPALVPQQTPEPAPNPKSNVKVPRGGPPPTNVSPDATPLPTPTPALNSSPTPSNHDCPKNSVSKGGLAGVPQSVGRIARGYDLGTKEVLARFGMAAETATSKGRHARKILHSPASHKPERKPR